MQACDIDLAQFPRSLDPYLANSSLLSMPLWSLSRFRYWPYTRRAEGAENQLLSCISLDKSSSRSWKYPGNCFHFHYMGLVVRKPVFEVSDKASFKQSPQLQRPARKLKFHLKQVYIWYFPKSEKKGADQTVPVLFANPQRQVFSRWGPYYACITGARQVTLCLPWSYIYHMTSHLRVK